MSDEWLADDSMADGRPADRPTGDDSGVESWADDRRLSAVLASAGRYLVVEASADGADRPAPLVRGRRTEGRRRLLAAAVTVAVMVGAVVSIAPARRAVGGWLRAGRIDISIDPDAHVDQYQLPSFIEGATPIDPARSAEFVGRPPPDVTATSLGEPQGWWTVPEGGVLLTWDEGETSLWIVTTDAHQSGMINKLVNSAGAVTDLPNLGDGGFAVRGTHVMQTGHRRMTAASVVAWQEGGLTFRLESSSDLDLLTAIARSIDAM